MQKFINLSPELRKAVETIRFECISHKDCSSCPLLVENNCGMPYCGITSVYDREDILVTPEDWGCVNDEA